MADIQILVVEDESIVALDIQNRLRNLNYIVSGQACSGEEAISKAAEMRPDLVLMDIKLKGKIDGVEAARQIQAQLDIPIVYLTAFADEQTLQRAKITEPFGYLLKPFEDRDLYTAIEMALYKHQTEQKLKNRKQQLDTALIKLQARNAELNAFARTVAHGLQDPLSSIIGFTDALSKYYDAMSPEELQDYFQIIMQQGQKMSNIINELLLLAGVRRIKVEIEPLDMDCIVAEAQQRLAHMIEEYHAEIVLPASWPVALGYGPWIEEVWVNYLSNAIKYGDQPPHVELGATTSNGTNGMVCFWIRDNGPGLTPEEQARLFMPFTRFDQVKANGSGLGLSIVQCIIEKLGGQVAVESVIGEGSVFSFTLPRAVNNELS